MKRNDTLDVDPAALATAAALSTGARGRPEEAPGGGGAGVDEVAPAQQ